MKHIVLNRIKVCLARVILFLLNPLLTSSISLKLHKTKNNWVLRESIRLVKNVITKHCISKFLFDNRTPTFLFGNLISSQMNYTKNNNLINEICFDFTFLLNFCIIRMISYIIDLIKHNI